jgi:hypothetical protein
VNGGAELFAIQTDTGYVSLLQAKMQKSGHCAPSCS